MDFSLTEEQKMLQQTVRQFAREEIAPHAAELDATSTFPSEGVKKMAELGLMGIRVPHDLGGGGMD
ncbi:MAG: acyl-CoA dehydrogenase family protein, partial [Deltaproteobacteria bacterium]|nr:acyl-CoA dehydrogenase family protein [Deltaproteobacteria bacterium]